MRYPKKKAPNPMLQIHKMKHYGYEFTWQSGKNQSFTILIKLRPKEASQTYQVKISFGIGQIPKAFVTSPQLKRGSPHTYPDGSLCLYHPDDFNWTDDKALADWIVPWIAAWLFFYEGWLETGIWYGEEAPHDRSK